MWSGPLRGSAPFHSNFGTMRYTLAAPRGEIPVQDVLKLCKLLGGRFHLPVNQNSQPQTFEVLDLRLWNTHPIQFPIDLFPTRQQRLRGCSMPSVATQPLHRSRTVSPHLLGSAFHCCTALRVQDRSRFRMEDGDAIIDRAIFERFSLHCFDSRVAS